MPAAVAVVPAAAKSMTLFETVWKLISDLKYLGKQRRWTAPLRPRADVFAPTPLSLTHCLATHRSFWLGVVALLLYKVAFPPHPCPPAIRGCSQHGRTRRAVPSDNPRAFCTPRLFAAIVPSYLRQRNHLHRWMMPHCFVLHLQLRNAFRPRAPPRALKPSHTAQSERAPQRLDGVFHHSRRCCLPSLSPSPSNMPGRG